MYRFALKMRLSYTPKKQSYTLSYTRKHLYLHGVSTRGVGNVVFFQETFFFGGGRMTKRQRRNSNRDEKNHRERLDLISSSSFVSSPWQ